MESEWRTDRQWFLAALNREEFSETQMAIISGLLDDLPEIIISLLCWFVGRLKVIPVEEASSLANVLAQMIRETGYADHSRNN